MPVMTRNQIKNSNNSNNSNNNVPVVNLMKNVIPIPESSKQNMFVTIDQAEINYIRSLPGFKNRVILPGGVKLMKDCIGLTTRKCAQNISYSQFFDDDEDEDEDEDEYVPEDEDEDED